MAEKNKDSSLNRLSLFRIQSLLRTTTRLVATRSIRLFILGLAVLMTGWLLYQNVWNPLHEEIILPAGVTPHNPRLDEGMLETITNARVERTQHTIRPFTGIERVLTQPSPSPAAR
jgi:hypothetical protein